MKIKKITVIYFSPVGTCRRTAGNIGAGCRQAASGPEPVLLDITPFDARWAASGLSFGPGELAAAVVPVYAGRIPEPAAVFFRNAEASGASFVPIVVYGNRAYDDALLELKDLGESRGFRTIAAAAFVAEHSLCGDVASGRPDDEDRAAQEDFGRRIVDKAASLAAEPLSVPGNRPYRPAMDIPLSPETTEGCTGCAECAEICPVKAIDPLNPQLTDKARCILCGACIRSCRPGARRMLHPALKALEARIAGIGNQRVRNEIFL